MTLDNAYRNLEEMIRDLTRLCEITVGLVRESSLVPDDRETPGRACLIAEITRERMQRFQDLYYEWWDKPPCGVAERSSLKDEFAATFERVPEHFRSIIMSQMREFIEMEAKRQTG